MKPYFKAEDFKSPEACLILVDDSTRQLLNDLTAAHAIAANARIAPLISAYEVLRKFAEHASDKDGYYEAKPHKLMELVYESREALSQADRLLNGEGK